MINKDGGDNFSILWGDAAVMRGDIELMGVPPVPPLEKTLDRGTENNIMATIQCFLTRNDTPPPP